MPKSITFIVGLTLCMLAASCAVRRPKPLLPQEELTTLFDIRNQTLSRAVPLCVAQRREHLVPTGAYRLDDLRRAYGDVAASFNAAIDLMDASVTQWTNAEAYHGQVAVLADQTRDHAQAWSTVEKSFQIDQLMGSEAVVNFDLGAPTTSVVNGIMEAWRYSEGLESTRRQEVRKFLGEKRMPPFDDLSGMATTPATPP